jgi:hypothetical protein
MNSDFIPTLLIGAGGTGIKALRFIHALAKLPANGALNEYIESGLIQLVGIDTDPASNNEEIEIDEKLVSFGNDHRDEPEVPGVLPVLDRWIHIDRLAINEAIPTVNELLLLGKTQGGGFDLPEPPPAAHRCILDWFPAPTDSGDSITLGHSKKAGAAQWRALGRMALFLQAQSIYSTLEHSLNYVSEHDPLNRKPRAHIISSLVGGTGSGMFWDLAFFLQMIDRYTVTIGNFLLPGPFSGLDEVERINLNAYAALKELSELKNWRQAEPFKVRYPFAGGLDRIFEGRPGMAPAFDVVYLYQSFPAGPDVADPRQSAVDVSCYRMAQNVVAQLRTDLFQTLDVAANNMTSDTTVLLSNPESAYVFSTSTTAAFQLAGVKDLTQYFQRRLLELMLERRKGAMAVGAEEMLRSLDLPEETGQSFRSLALSSLQELIRSREVSRASKLVRAIPPILERLRRDRVTPKLAFEELCRLPEAQGLAEAWRANRVFELELLDNDALQFLSTGLEMLAERLQKSVDTVRDEQAVLSPEGESYLVELIVGWQLSTETEARVPVARLAPGNAYTKVRRHLENREPRYLFIGPKVRTPKELAKQNVERVLVQMQSTLERHLTIPDDQLRMTMSTIWNRYSDRLLATLRELRQAYQENRDHEDAWLAAEEHARRTCWELKDKKCDPGQLEELIGGIRRDERRVEAPKAWSAEHTDQLVRLIQRQTTPSESEMPEESPELTRAVEESVKRFESLSRIRQEDDDEHKLLLDHLREMLLGAATGLSGEPEESVRRLGDLVKVVLEHWFEQVNNLLMRVGGKQGLLKILHRCRTTVFCDGVIDNRLARRRLAVIPPRLQLTSRKEVTRVFGNAAQEVLHAAPNVGNKQSEQPIIYFTNLFRSAEEIDKIQEYRAEYLQLPAEAQRLYHISRDLADLPEIGGSRALHPVFCGNPGCRRDLRYLPRTELQCPECLQPIWNRCGNEKCVTDNLLDRLGLSPDDVRAGSIADSFPRRCPDCGETYQTAWWICKHHQIAVPTDKESCSECVDEFKRGERADEDISRRPDRNDRCCPGCIELGVDEEKQTLVSEPLLRFYNDGVNGHDKLRFNSLVKRFRLDEHNCGQGIRDHIIFPTCPEGVESPDTRHHIYRKGDRFVCARHPKLEFDICYHCRYPIPRPADGKRDSTYEQTCPRCLKPLAYCDFCSPNDGMLFQRLPAGKIHGGRCRRCGNPMVINKKISERDLREDLAHPAFCRNIYGCKAGANLWWAVTEYGTKDSERTCRACRHDDTPLISWYDLQPTIDSCPLCMVVLGTKKVPSPLTTKYTPEYIMQEMLKLATRPDPKLDEPCLICGTVPAVVSLWMERTGFFKTEVKEEVEEEARDDQIEFKEKVERESKAAKSKLDMMSKVVSHRSIPEFSFNAAWEVLDTLREYQDDREAFQLLKKPEVLDNLYRDYPKIMDSILRAFPSESRSSSAISRRLHAINRLLNEDKRRVNDWISGSP